MKYWVYMNGEVPGAYAPLELAALKGFSMTTLVCPAEGEILEKNWRRSGEFSDIIKVVHERDSKLPPTAPVPIQDVLTTGDVNALIDGASSRLFLHVADMMKELENRREERALTVSLQRQVVALKDQLQQLEKANKLLESRLTRLAELEDMVRKGEGELDGVRQALKAREEGLSELRGQLERARADADAQKRRLGEAQNDLTIRNRLVDKLSRDLTEKEVSLAKALGVIRRLEEDFHRLTPTPAPEAAAPAEPLPVVTPEKEDAPAVASAEPPLPNQPAAQSALISKLRNLLPRDH